MQIKAGFFPIFSTQMNVS